MSRAPQSPPAEVETHVLLLSTAASVPVTPAAPPVAMGWVAATCAATAAAALGISTFCVSIAVNKTAAVPGAVGGGTAVVFPSRVVSSSAGSAASPQGVVAVAVTAAAAGRDEDDGNEDDGVDDDDVREAMIPVALGPLYSRDST